MAEWLGRGLQNLVLRFKSGRDLKNMHYTYFIKSKNKKWVYVGSTSDLVRRLKRHNSGLVKSTKYYKPFELIYYEAYKTLSMARKRELEIKKNSQQKEIILERVI